MSDENLIITSYICNKCSSYAPCYLFIYGTFGEHPNACLFSGSDDESDFICNWEKCDIEESRLKKKKWNEFRCNGCGENEPCKTYFCKHSYFPDRCADKNCETSAWRRIGDEYKAPWYDGGE